MSLTTHSKFYFGIEIDETNYFLDFSEGDGELTAELDFDKYSLTELGQEIARAMNDVGGQIYTVTVDRSTRQITIASTGNFSLLVGTGTHGGASVFSTAGFTGSDRSAANSYEGDAAAGSEYATQFILQSHISSEDQRGPAYGAVNKSASGVTETIVFGEEKFVSFNIQFATNNSFPVGAPIRSNATGVQDLREFMRYVVEYGPIEFMPDENALSTFETLVIESTPDDQKGLKYKLKEMYDKGMPGYFETGILKFRVVD